MDGWFNFLETPSPNSLVPALPSHLSERTRVYSRSGMTAEQQRSHDFVLYWMRTAVRSDENPALDVACHLASSLGLPLLVYQAISDDYEFASDRHHRFMLEGARDVQQQLAAQQISYAFHLTTDDDQDKHLLTLAQRACWVVTEDMPVDPPRRFLNVLIRETQAKVLAVDTACVVPMQVVGKAYTRAFEYRSATAGKYRRRVSQPWPRCTAHPQPFPMSSLPFRPLDLQAADLSDLLSSCQIDHAVGPIPGTAGGSTAGYERWREFVNGGLHDYHLRRNNPLHAGVSRMSAYLHYGMVSPFRLAREVAAVNHAGAEKYLDELLIWRELAYCYCCYTPNFDQWTALPAWARNTLEENTNVRRSTVYTWEQLARAQTDDALWNAAQASLLSSGELHNNVRMTWGKAILNWTPTPQAALNLMIDLNHRYALDGRDPASYGGILWCLGQFDRPFQPPQPIFGTVRPRSTSEHARRLNVESYRKQVRCLSQREKLRVAVIGAGIAGVTAARTLVDHDLSVTVFEKSRGVGGRMATRLTDHNTAFDHGAQYFTARDPRFLRYVESWEQQGIVTSWPVDPTAIVTLKRGHEIRESQPTRRFVGVPKMTAVAKHLSHGLNVNYNTRIEKLRAAPEQNFQQSWELFDDTGRSCGCFDRVIIAIPAPQAVTLVGGCSELTTDLQRVEMQPCWAALVELPQNLDVQWHGAFIKDSPVSWVSRNGTKPGRQSAVESLVIHATPDWTLQHLDDEPAQVGGSLLEAFWTGTGLTPQQPIDVQSHRWRYAIAPQPLQRGAMIDPTGTRIVCGDWCHGSRIEGAFLSGTAAAGRVLRSFRSLSSKSEMTQLQLF